jgi:hypothetical protein
MFECTESARDTVGTRVQTASLEWAEMGCNGLKWAETGWNGLQPVQPVTRDAVGAHTHHHSARYTIPREIVSDCDRVLWV